jgi:hypothetical protein
MIAFLSYWYFTSPARYLFAVRRLLRTLEETIAIQETAQHIAEPLFQDYSRQGRIVGFFFRLGRILAGVFLYGLVSLGAVLLLIFQWAFPILCLISIFSIGGQGE